MNKLDDLKMVHVIWTDSMSARGWQSAKEIEGLIAEIADIHSVGYLIHKDDQKLVLCGSIDRHEQSHDRWNFNHYHEIPLSMVKSVQELTVDVPF